MKIRKILILCMIILILFTKISNAKYKYYFEETIIKLNRDSKIPTCNVSYSAEEWTNQNVVVAISSDKPIQQVSGFELSEDRKTLTKEVSQNEANTVEVRDDSGNCTELEYDVNIIDKEPPEIIGCANGGTYNKPLVLDFNDDNEIKDIVIDKYSEQLYIYVKKEQKFSNLTVEAKEHPLETKKYKYFINHQLYATSIDNNYTFTGLKENTNYKVKVQALDEKGNLLDEKIQEVQTNDKSTTVANTYTVKDETEEEKDDYEITESGNYQIKVSDLAGNETVYYIKVK